ncbi:MAG: DNA polymerase III subunit delta' [Bacillota bacterium]
MDYTSLKDAQRTAVEFLEKSYKNGRLSHAYIFEGHAGTMKMQTALFFASMVLCKDDSSHLPCGVCHNCRRIEHRTHPNVHFVEPSKKQILKEDIQGLQHDFNRTALEDGPKVYIIDQADTMNAHAANALLKFLEEPHPDIFGILITDDLAHLLPTIVSRSQIVPFHPLPTSAMERSLIDLGYDQTLAKLAARIQDTLDDAEAYIQDETLVEIVDEAMSMYGSIVSGTSPLLAFDEHLSEYLWKHAEHVLDVCIHYQKDMIYGKIENQGDMVFAEHAETSLELSKRYTLSDLLKLVERFISIKASIKNYINVRLAMDNAMIELERRMSYGI